MTKVFLTDRERLDDHLIDRTPCPYCGAIRKYKLSRENHVQACKIIRLSSKAHLDAAKSKLRF